MSRYAAAQAIYNEIKRDGQRVLTLPEIQRVIDAHEARDADILRQARERAERVDPKARDWVLGTYGAAQTFFTLGDLLDLLAPVPDTGADDE